MTAKITITPQQREQIKTLAGYGLTDLEIATVLKLNERTLRRRCQQELKEGRILAKSSVQQSAFKMATNQKHPAMTIFWLKTRCGWRESGELPSIPTDEKETTFKDELLRRLVKALVKPETA